jgi:two-component system nitrate/nitrite response regulator NarL
LNEEFPMEASGQEIRILIADPLAMFRDALRILLEMEPDFRVIGEASDGRGIFDLVTGLKPDLLLLDLSLPRLSGLEVLQGFLDRSIEVRTLLLAASIETSQLVEAIRLGARGVIMKDTPTKLLFRGIRAVAHGEYWIAHDGVAGLVECLRTTPLVAGIDRNGDNGTLLSRREKEIMGAIVDGCTNREIARKFSLSEQTVKHHLTKIFDKVGVSNRLELALYAMQNRLSA